MILKKRIVVIQHNRSMPKNSSRYAGGGGHAGGGGMIDPPSGSVPLQPSTETGLVAKANTTLATSSPDEFPDEASGAKSQLGRFYSCLWTLFDYEPHLDKLRRYADEIPDYMVWGFEICPKTNRPHLQGYVHWTNKRSIGAFSQTFNNCWVHKAHADATTNRAYCLKIREQDPKPNERWEEFGDVPRQGTRNDWSLAVTQLQQRHSVAEVVAEQPHMLPAIRALERFSVLSRQPPKDRDVRVIYIHGPPGCGKTRSIRDRYPDAYWKPEGQWWDGYEGQSVVVLDDFYGEIPATTLLRVLDRYPLRLPVKGGFAPAEYTTVIISSNIPFSELYTLNIALNRRIHCVLIADNHITPEDITHASEIPQVRAKDQAPPSCRPSACGSACASCDAEPHDR